jgi:hypothetical protein
LLESLCIQEGPVRTGHADEFDFAAVGPYRDPLVIEQTNWRALEDLAQYVGAIHWGASGDSVNTQRSIKPLEDAARRHPGFRIINAGVADRIAREQDEIRPQS